MYIDSIKGSVLSLVLLGIAAFFIPGHGQSEGVQTILTISTFLFAILAGFYISRLNTRYDQIRELVAQEDALWLSVYKISQFYGAEFQNRIRDLIDSYYIIAYDHDVGTYYKHNAREFLQVFTELQTLKTPRDNNSDGLVSDYIMLLPQIEICRNKSSVLIRERLAPGQWATTVFLATIILFSIFYLKTPEFYSQLSAVLLGTVLVLVLLTIRDLQNLRLWGQTVADESGQEIFDFIGKPRYYNKLYIDEGVMIIPKELKTYRLGTHRPGDTPQITLIEIN